MNNIYQYIVGQTRYILYKIHPKLVRLHIREQVGWRQSACSPVCKYEARCCGCKAPNVFFAPKKCSFGSYPELMNRIDWENYKHLYNYLMRSYLDYTKVDGIYPHEFGIFYVNELPHEKIIEYYENATINSRQVLMKPQSVEMAGVEYENDLFIETE